MSTKQPNTNNPVSKLNNILLAGNDIFLKNKQATVRDVWAGVFDFKAGNTKRLLLHHQAILDLIDASILLVKELPVNQALYLEPLQVTKKTLSGTNLLSPWKNVHTTIYPHLKSFQFCINALLDGNLEIENKSVVDRLLDNTSDLISEMTKANIPDQIKDLSTYYLQEIKFSLNLHKDRSQTEKGKAQ